jgi:RND family efflux transporter MFP subunit
MKLPLKKLKKIARQLIVGALFIALVTVLMLWLAGRFSPKIAPALGADSVVEGLPQGATVVPVNVVRLPVTESAVGTIEAVHETTIASRILARVVELNLHAGQPVKKGDVLIRLDDTDLQARLEQAEAAANSAKAARDQAAIDEKRLASLIASKAVSAMDYDKATTALKTSEADLVRANQSVAEAQAILSYATILSSMDGIVIDKKVDIGDTVSPGQALVSIYDPQHMQLVANVRESLAIRLQVGQNVVVQLDAADKTYQGQISEMVPDAQSASRTFQVKVTGAFPPNLYTGTFGRMFVPLEQENVLEIPKAAIRNVGELELVDVWTDGVRQRRAVRTGETLGDNCEVLSGLRAGEQVIVPANFAINSATSQPAGGGQP